MGKQKTKGTSKIPKVSGGMRRATRAKRALKRIMMKIARWERNKSNPKKVSRWHRKQNPHKRSRHYNWDTAGLKRHAEFLQSIVNKGRKVRGNLYK